MTGTYKLIKSENFDEYMAAIGVGFMLRKMAATATPTCEITQSGDEWNMKTSTTFKTTEIKFKMGEAFDETTADGRKCKSTIAKEGDNKLIHKQICGDQTLDIIREFTDNEMKMILTAPGGIVSTRIYQKV